jgi:multidrug efflux pump subunit AcrA (membrane-fusion protein)
VSCGASAPGRQTPTPLPPIVNEEKITFPVERGPITAQREAIGEVVPDLQDILFFRSPGFLNRINVRPGDQVKKGDILAELQVDDLLSQLQQARLDLENAQNAYEQEKKQHVFELQKAESDAEIVASQVELARMRYEQSTGSAKETAGLDLKIAEERLKTAQAWLELVKSSPESQSSGAVERNQLTVQRLEQLVEERQIIAPYDGIILDSYRSNGTNVDAFAPVLLIGDTSRLLIRIGFDQEFSTILNETTPAFVLDATDPDASYPVKYLPDFLPVTNQEGGLTFSGDEIKLNYLYFTTPEEQAAPILKPGQGVKLRIIMGEKQDALLLPPAAIRGSPDFQYVIVLEDDADSLTHRRVEIVQVGLKTGNYWEVIADLKEGDLVLGP